MNEIIETEVATELTEGPIMAEPNTDGLSPAAKVGGLALLGLGVWKAGELTVKGFKKIRAWVKNRRNKNQPEQTNSGEQTNATHDDCFDQTKYGD